MIIASDEALATLCITFGADVLKAGPGREAAAILAKDTTFGQAIAGQVPGALAPVAGIEAREIVVCDIKPVDFAPVFAKARASGADVICQAVSSQYVKLQVPLAMTGVNVGAPGLERRQDTGGAGTGTSTLSPVPPAGPERAPVSAAFVEACQARDAPPPTVRHFNGFNACHGPRQAHAAAAFAMPRSGRAGWRSRTSSSCRSASCGCGKPSGARTRSDAPTPTTPASTSWTPMTTTGRR